MDKQTEFIESLIDKTKQHKIIWYESYGEKLYSDEEDEPVFYYTDIKSFDSEKYILKFYHIIKQIYINDEKVITMNVPNNYWIILLENVENQVEQRKDEESEREQIEWDKRQDKLLDIGLSW